MKCKKCGKELKSTWKVCPECGEPVRLESGCEKVKCMKKPVYKKIWFWILVVIAGFVGLGIYGSNLPDEEMEQKAVEKEITDFSEYDLQDIIDKPESEAESIGLKQGEKKNTYTGLGDKIQITYVSGTVQTIQISGNAEKAPALYGVRIGMRKEEIEGNLLGNYPEKTETESDETYMNLETKNSIVCSIADGKVNAITFQKLSDEEIAEYKKIQEEQLREQYIFPDSDKKYLSEDEIRNVEAEKLAIGRNEIFARHGYIFKSEELKKHFESTSWYEGTISADDFNSDSVFNEFEKKNVELIKQIEDEINGFSFSGRKGSYVCTNPEYSEWTGRIEILGINDDSFEFVLDVLNPDYEYDILSGTAIITGDNKAEFSGRGIKLIFSWSDDSTFYIEQSGIYEGQDADIIDITTDNACYVWALEFNQ